MPDKISRRLIENNIKLPEVSAPAGSYLSYTQGDSLIFISGQIAFWNGELLLKGKLGRDLTIDEGQDSSRYCGLNLLAHLQNACNGNLDKVEKVIKLNGFVNCTDDFTDQPKVIDGVSQLMIQVFGDRGKHARAAVGCASLPLGASVEVEAIFQIGVK